MAIRVTISDSLIPFTRDDGAVIYFFRHAIRFVAPATNKPALSYVVSGDDATLVRGSAEDSVKTINDHVVIEWHEEVS